MSVEAIEIAPARKRVGRPSSYNPEIASEICEALAYSDKSLDWLCANRSSFPPSGTVFRWMENHAEFRESYLRAKERQADYLFDQCTEISDDDSLDKENPAQVQRARLRIETRKWVAGKLRPKAYGESKTLTVDANLNVQQSTVDMRQLAPEHRAAIEQILLLAASDNAKVIEGSATSDDDVSDLA